MPLTIKGMMMKIFQAYIRSGGGLTELEDS